MRLQVINELDVKTQGQGQIKDTSKERYSYAVDLHLTQMHSKFKSKYRKFLDSWIL